MLTAAASLFAAFPAFAQEAQFDPSQPGGAVLPDGAGKKLVQDNCVGCHDLRRVVTANNSPEDWRNVVNMMKSAGAPLTPDQVAIVTDYLNKSFPGKGKPKAVIVPGPVTVSFKEWPVPTLGSRPHDPLAARDGSIWYTGQMANKLGRLDPATGSSRNSSCRSRPARTASPRTRTAISGTRRISAAISASSTRRPATVKQFKMPDPRRADPAHAAVR